MRKRKATNRRLRRQGLRFRELLEENDEKFEMAWCSYLDGMISEIRWRTERINEPCARNLIDRVIKMLEFVGADAVDKYTSQTLLLLVNEFDRSIAEVSDRRIYRLVQKYTKK